jgi:hypothetical protein
VLGDGCENMDGELVGVGHVAGDDEFGLLLIDDWAAHNGAISRSEAIRRLVELGLAASQPLWRRSPKAASKALDLAAQKIDKLIDPSTPGEERSTRKRRLLKGPKEFRDIRLGTTEEGPLACAITEGAQPHDGHLTRTRPFGLSMIVCLSSALPFSGWAGRLSSSESRE